MLNFKFNGIGSTTEKIKKEGGPNIKQQNKIVKYFEEGRKPEVLQEDGVILEKKEKEKFLELVASGEITREDFKGLLINIMPSVNQYEPAVLFGKITGNRQMEKMFAYLVSDDNNPGVYKSTNARDAERFLRDVPEPFSFEKKIKPFLEEIKELNPSKKFEEYQNSMQELMRKVYGKRYEYYKQMQLLEKEAENKYPGLVRERFEKALILKDDEIVEELLKKEFQQFFEIIENGKKDKFVPTKYSLNDEEYLILRQKSPIINSILENIHKDINSHYAKKFLKWEEEAFAEYMEKRDVQKLAA